MRILSPSAFAIAALAALSSSPSLGAGGITIHATPIAVSAGLEARPIAVAKPEIAPEALDAVPGAVADELSRAQPYPSAIVHGTRYHAPSNCKVESAELTAPLVASGRTSLRVSGLASNGRPCQAYAFVDVKITAEALVATRAIREGDLLAGSMRLMRREIINGETPLTELPQGALASRSLAPGQMIASALVRMPGLNPGSPIRILVRTGALSLEETGRVVRCGELRDPSRACAQVASGARIEGTYRDGAIVVETP